MIPMEEARALSDSDRDILQHTKEIIRRHEPDAEVLLYGSHARGEPTPESDYDVLVLTPHKLSTAQEDGIYDAVYEFEVAHDVVISVVFYTRDEWNTGLVQASPFYKHVTQECIAA
jgi:predicted nucleotidyltransferase